MIGGGLLQPGHLIIILIIALIIFGPGKLPELGSSLGKGIREFKHSVSGDGDETSRAAGTLTAPATTATVPPAADIATAAPVTGAVCAQCNSPAATDARFCTRCGRQLAA